MDISGRQPGKRQKVARSIDGVRPAVPKSVPKRNAAPKIDVSANLQDSPPQPGEHDATVSWAAALGQGVTGAERAESVDSSVPTSIANDESQRYYMPDYEPPKRPARVTRRRWSRKAIVWWSIGAVLLLVLLTGGFLAWRAYANLHKIFRGHTTVAALNKKPQAPEQLKNEGDSRVNILLLGVGGPGHQGPDLTDTIVILSVDPVNSSAAMISVPRDLWVDMPVNYFGKQQKINAAYESGKYKLIGGLDSSNKNAEAVEAGFDSIDTVIKQVMDVRIDYHVLVNFRAFKQAVDTVGGITIDVPTRLYDPSMAWENHWNPVLAEAGEQHMDGTKALLYARSRKSTSDFARTDRQRQILLAIKDKALSLGTLSNPAKIDGLMTAFGDNIYSDMSTEAASRLYDILKKVGDTSVTSASLSDEGHKLVVTDRIGNTSIDRPVAGLYNYKDIQDYVHSKIPDGYLTKERASVAVVGTTLVGANATASLLKSYGYTVTGVSVSQTDIQKPILVDLSKGKNPYTKHYLEARFDTKAVAVLPTLSGLTANSAKFVIMVPK